MIVSAVIDTDGLPKEIKVVSGLGLGLDEAAVGAVRQYRFKPATTKDGRPVKVAINVEVNFKPADFTTKNTQLFPAAESRATPPKFPGVDLAKYPLQVHITNAGGVPTDFGYEVNANAVVSRSGGKHSLAIYCSGKHHDCSVLVTGTYQARWIAENRDLEILGKDRSSSGWRKAEYSVRTQPPSQATP